MTRLASIRVFVAVILSITASLKAQTSNAPTSGVMLSPLTPTPAEESLRSINSNTPALIRFVNRSNTPVDIYWINFDGTRRMEVSGLAVGAIWPETTFLTHPFLAIVSGTGAALQTGSGTLLAVFKAATPNPTHDLAKQDTAIITNLDGSSNPAAPPLPAPPGTSGPDGVYTIGPGVTKPKLISSVRAEHTEVSRKLEISGSVVLGFVVSTDGIAREIKIQRSLAYGLDEKAIEAIRKWRFTPSMKDGVPVAVRASADIRFDAPVRNSKSWYYSNPMNLILEPGVVPPSIKDVAMPKPSDNSSIETVALGFTIDPQGNVRDITTIQGSEAASDLVRPAFARWKFKPAMRGDEPVEAKGTVRFVKGENQVPQSPPQSTQTAPPVTANSSQPAQPPTLSNPVARPETVSVRTASDSIDGIIRRLAEKELLLQISSSVVLRFRLLARTEFRGQDGRPVRDSLLHPGDHITVNVNPDDVETALAVVLRKSATSAEREAASPEVAPETIVTPDPSHFAAAREPVTPGTPAAAATNGAPNAPRPQAAGNDIKFRFKAVSAQVSVNGGQPAPIDLTVELFANTAKRLKARGLNGSDLYGDLQGFFSSKALGFSDVAAITPLSVHIGSPNSEPRFKNSTAFLASGNVMCGIFNMRAIETWDRVSPIGPLFGSAISSGPLKVMLKTGETLSITTLESLQPYGTAAFEATTISETDAARSSGVENSKVNPTDGQRYVWVPAGTFVMGCSDGDTMCRSNERPSRRVAIQDGFWMGQTEVTQEAYRLVLHTNPSAHKGDQLPVESMRWEDAAKYCATAGGRLPTEAEWEYAARAGTATARYGDINEIAWHNGNSGEGSPTHPVALKQPNAFGLYDMLGNVWEWLGDSPNGGERIIRGGAAGMTPDVSRASLRNNIAITDVIGVRRGFRCIWSGGK